MLVLPGMDGNDPDVTRARFAADLHAVATAVAAARCFGTAEGLKPDTQMRLAIIVEELVANLVEHGDAVGRPIELHLSRTPDAVALTLLDEGAPFDPRDAQQPDLPPERGGGAGIALVLAWSRIIGYNRNGATNQLRLALPLNG